MIDNEITWRESYNGVADKKSKYYLPSSVLIALPAKEGFFTHFQQLPVVGVILPPTIFCFFKRVFLFRFLRFDLGIIQKYSVAVGAGLAPALLFWVTARVTPTNACVSTA